MFCPMQYSLGSGRYRNTCIPRLGAKKEYGIRWEYGPSPCWEYGIRSEYGPLKPREYGIQPARLSSAAISHGTPLSYTLHTHMISLTHIRSTDALGTCTCITVDPTLSINSCMNCHTVSSLSMQSQIGTTCRVYYVNPVPAGLWFTPLPPVCGWLCVV